MRNCLEIFLEEYICRNFLGGIFWKNFLGEFFWEEFFRSNFLRGIFWEEFFGKNLNMKGIVKILSEWRRKEEFLILRSATQAHRT